MSDSMSTPTFFLFRESSMQGDGNSFDPTSTIHFYPPKDSDDLFDALRAAYPNTKTHSERMRDAVIDFLVTERNNERVNTHVAETPSTWPSTSTSSTLSSPDLIDLATPASTASPVPSMARHPSRSSTSGASMEQMTSVFSLSNTSQPKTRVRRKMTDSEKAEYRKRRMVKACDKCSKRKRKCEHNQEKMETLASKVTKRVPSVSHQVERQPPDVAFPVDMDPLSFLTDDALLSLDDTTQPQAAADSSLGLPDFDVDFTQQAAQTGAWPWSETHDWTLIDSQPQHYPTTTQPLFGEMAGLDDFSMSLQTRHQTPPVQGGLNMPQAATNTFSVHSPSILESSAGLLIGQPLDFNGGGDLLQTEGLPSGFIGHGFGLQATRKRHCGGFDRSAFLGDSTNASAAANSTMSAQASGALDRLTPLQVRQDMATPTSTGHQQALATGSEPGLLISKEKGKAAALGPQAGMQAGMQGNGEAVGPQVETQGSSQSRRRRAALSENVRQESAGASSAGGLLGGHTSSSLNGSRLGEASAPGHSQGFVNNKASEHVVRASGTMGLTGLTTGRLTEHDQAHAGEGIGRTLPTVQQSSPVLTGQTLLPAKSRMGLAAPANEGLQAPLLLSTGDRRPRLQNAVTTGHTAHTRAEPSLLQTHARSAGDSSVVTSSLQVSTATANNSTGLPLQAATTALQAVPLAAAPSSPSRSSASSQNTPVRQGLSAGPSQVEAEKALGEEVEEASEEESQPPIPPFPSRATTTRTVAHASPAPSHAKLTPPSSQAAATAAMATASLLQSGALLQLTRALTVKVLDSMEATGWICVPSSKKSGGLGGGSMRYRMVSCV